MLRGRVARPGGRSSPNDLAFFAIIGSSEIWKISKYELVIVWNASVSGAFYACASYLGFPEPRLKHEIDCALFLSRDLKAGQLRSKR